MENKRKYNILGFFGVCILLGLDWWTKWLACNYLKGQDSISIIDGVFELQYLENRGAAFGILQNQRVFLLSLTVIILFLLIYAYGKIPSGKQYHALRMVAVLFAAGAVGNMLDRFFRRYVVDFLYFKMINFPIFNVADCYVVIAAIIAILLFLFYYKEEDFEKEK